ncbi:MAG: DUF4249 family protein [Bacteroidia bacterium]
MNFRQKHTGFLIMGFVLMAFSACIEAYNDGNQREAGILVITGAVSSSPGPYSLHISRTSVYTRITEPVCCATARLFDTEGNSEPFYEFSDGLYQCTGTVIRPVPGKAYFVEVELENGNRYQSEPDTMPEVNGEVQLLSRLDSLSRRLDFFTNARIDEGRTLPCFAGISAIPTCSNPPIFPILLIQSLLPATLMLLYLNKKSTFQRR